MLVWSPNHCVSDAKREWDGHLVRFSPGRWGLRLFSEVGWKPGL
jgi:hypothetical protein